MKRSAIIASAAVAVAVSLTMTTGCKAKKPRRNRPDTPVAVQVQPQPVTPAEVVPPPPPATDEFDVKTLPPPPPPVTEVKPLPPPPPPPAPKAESFEYRVQPGESLSRIAKRYKTNVKAIVALNPSISNPDNVQAGKKIKIPAVEGVTPPPAPTPAPAPSTPALAPVADYTGPTQDYVVQSGDTLSGLAYKWGVSMATIKKMNGIAPGPATNGLRIGQKLKLPAEKQVRQAAAKTEPAKTVDKKETKAPAAESKTEEKVVKQDAAEDKPTVEEPAPAVEEKKPEGKFHIVADGEDIVTIAINYEVSPGQIVELNSDIVSTAADPVEQGTRLRLPPNAKMP